MEHGRSTGVGGGARGLVAGVRAVLRSRSFSNKSKKSRPRSCSEGSLTPVPQTVTPPPSNNNNNHNNKNYKSPKSPFLGWRRTKSKDSSKAKVNASPKDAQATERKCSKDSLKAKANTSPKDAQATERKCSKDSLKAKANTSPKETQVTGRRGSKDSLKAKANTSPKDALVTERKGSCSQSQAKRLCSHSLEDYKPTSKAQRNDNTGQPTTAGSKDVTKERVASSAETLSNPSECSKVKVDRYVGGINADEGKGHSSDTCRYVNLPRTCVGVSAHVKTENSASDGQNCAKSCTTNHVSNNNENSASSSSESIVVSTASSSDSGQDRCRLEGCSDEGSKTGSESRGVVRDRGDGSDTHDVCDEGKLENEVCVGYFKDIYRSSKEDSLNLRGGPTELARGPWLKSALKYNLHMPESPRNEVIVLALGIDQYIEEVFGYLDQWGTGKVSAEDFEALCQVLELKEEGKEEKEGVVQKCQCLGSNLTLHGSLDGSLINVSKLTDVKCPLHLSLNEFRDRLCERFIRGAKTESLLPLAVRRPSNQRLVTSVVRIQRRYDVLENISRSLAEVSAKLDGEEARPIDECPATGVVCSNCQQMAHVDRNSNISSRSFNVPYLQQQVLLLEQELHCLREVIEDMRIALQSSDAENLALQVRVKRGIKPGQRTSQHELSLTDEEDTIDDLVRQLTELSRPALTSGTADTPAAPSQTPGPGAAHPQTPVPGAPHPQTPVPGAAHPQTPVPGAPHPQTPVPGAPHPQTPVTGAAHPQTPVPGAPHPQTPVPGAAHPQAPVPGAVHPQTPGPRVGHPQTPVPGAGQPQTPVQGAGHYQTPFPVAAHPQTPVPGAGHPQTPVPMAAHPQTPVPRAAHLQTPVPVAAHPQAFPLTTQEPERPDSPDDPLNTAFISGDLSLEAELQSTYEALQTAREEREAMQADLQQTVGQLQEREADLRGAKLTLNAAHTALEKAHYDNHALVMEMAETRRTLEESRSRLTEAWEDLRQAKETVLQKEKQLQEAQANLHILRSSRERLVQGLTTARGLVAGSLEQVRAGEHALHTLAAHSPAHFHPNTTTRLDSTCRADSGLYSEESERDDDTKSPDRSSGHISASEDDLWTPRAIDDPIKDPFSSDTRRGDDSSSSASFKSPSSLRSEFEDHTHGILTPQLILIGEGDVPQWKSPSSGLPSTSTEIIEGLEKEVQWLQYTLNEAEKEWDEEQRNLSEDEVIAREKAELLEEELRQVEAERTRLIIIEDKLRQLLQVLLSLADMNLSRRTLSRLVLEALEDCSGIKLGDLSTTGVAGDGGVSSLAFLNNLLSSTSSYQKLSTESLIHLALQGLTHTPGIPRFPERIEATLG